MKYISIDIETTGLNPDRCQVLSFGAVIEDTNNLLPLEGLPKFHCGIVHNNIDGELFALNLNRELISRINEYNVAKDKKEVEKKYGMIFRKEDEMVGAFKDFLVMNEATDIMGGVSHITVAGKNFGTFDKLFVEKLPMWKQYFKIRQRIIDPTILFTDWKEDESLPNLSTCLYRANCTNTEVSHDAVEDALDVIRLMRTEYGEPSKRVHKD